MTIRALPSDPAAADSTTRTACASLRDLVSVRSVVARAFYDDPFNTWVLPDQLTRLDATAALYGTFVEEHLASSSVEVLEFRDRVVAAALWEYGDAAVEMPAGLPRVGMLLAGLVGLERLGVIAEAYAAFEQLRPTEPHVHLRVLAVDPDYQGLGLGGRLLAAGVRRADAAGLGVHLVTHNSQNVLFYERHGFRVVEQRSLPHGSPDARSMWRARQ